MVVRFCMLMAIGISSVSMLSGENVIHDILSNSKTLLIVYKGD